MRYLICGEYGTHTGRPHIHILLWNLELQDIQKDFKDPIARTRGKNYITYQALSSWWTKGNCYISQATENTIAYVAQYATKKRLRSKQEKENWKKQGLQVEYQLSSKGLAFNYYEKNYKKLIANHGAYVDETHQTKYVDKSFIDYMKSRHPEYTELKAKDLYETSLNTYSELNDDNKIRHQREKNHLKNKIEKERM